MAVVAFGSLCWAQDSKPAAVQVCFTLPAGVSLFSPTPSPHHRAIAPDTYLLDFDLKLDKRTPDRLTRNGNDCVRAWLPATPLTSVSVSFERPPLNLVAQTRQVDLKLKPDLWYDAGRFVITRGASASATTGLPGSWVFERVSTPMAVVQSDLSQLPVGEYRIRYDAPEPPRGRCDASVRLIGVGTIREDNKPELFAELRELYRGEWVPRALEKQHFTCLPNETVEVEQTLFDGAFVDPLNPRLSRVAVPSRAPRYVLIVDGVEAPYAPGMHVTVGYGQRLELKARDASPLVASP